MLVVLLILFFFFKQKTAYEMRISDWSSDVCSSDLLRPERPAGEFPPGWAAWFDAMKVRTGAVTGATAEAIVAIFLAREPRLPPRALAVLNRWQAFNVLWRQQWHPASEDERGTRIVAIVVSLVAHLLDRKSTRLNSSH